MKEKILSVLILEININKGESLKIFKDGFVLEEGEYTCISYNSNEKNHIIKINDGIFDIPENFSGEVSETKFTFVLYFNYDPSIYDNNTDIENEDEDEEKIHL